MKIENEQTGEYVEFEWDNKREPTPQEAQQIWLVASQEGGIKKKSKSGFDLKGFLSQTLDNAKLGATEAISKIKQGADVVRGDPEAIADTATTGSQAIDMSGAVVTGQPFSALPKNIAIRAGEIKRFIQNPIEENRKFLEEESKKPAKQKIDEAISTVVGTAFGGSNYGKNVLKDLLSKTKPSGESFMKNQVELLKESGLSSKAVKEIIDNKAIELRKIAEEQNIPKAEAIAKIKELARPEIPEGYKMSKLTKNILKSDRPIEFKEDVLANPESVYKVRPHEVLKQEVNEIMTKTPEKVNDIVLKGDPNVKPDTQNTLAIDMIDKYIISGDRAMASKATAALTERGTTQGQAVTSLRNMNPTKGAAIYKAIDDKLLQLQKKNPKKYASIPESTKKEFYDMADEVVKLKDRTPNQAFVKNLRAHQLYTKLNNLIPDSVFNQGLSLYKSGLLTMLKSHARNISSNISHIVLNNISKYPATAYDMAISRVTGSPRTTTIPKYSELLGKGVEKGVRDARNVLKYGYAEGLPVNAGFEPSYSNNKLMKVLGTPAKAIFRGLKAEDRVTYRMEYSSAIVEQAKLKAINLGLKDTKIRNAKIKEFFDKPTDDMKKIADEQAKNAVFQQETLMGDAMKWLSTKTGKLSEIPAPFSKTPSAYFTEIVNYSPAGPLAEGFRQFVGMSKGQPFNQRSFVNNMGKATVGSIIGLGAYLAGKNAIEGFYPRGKPKEQSLDKLQNKTYKSIRIGDRQIPLNTAGVFGDLILLGALAKQAEAEKGTKADALVSVMNNLPKVIMDAPLMTNMNNIQNFLDDADGNAIKFFTNMASSVIPTITGAVTRGADPYKRFTKAKGFTDQLKATILSKVNPQALPPAVNVLGEKVTRDSSVSKEIFDFLATTKLKNQNDPITKEFVRLKNLDMNPTPTLLGIKEKISGKDLDIEPENVSVLQEYIGKDFAKSTKQLINSNIYKKLPDENKSKEIEKIHSDIKKVALVKYALQTGLFGRGDEFVELTNMDDSQRAFYLYGKYLLKPNISSVLKKQMEDRIRKIK